MSSNEMARALGDAAGHLGVDEARADRVDRHTELAQLEGEGLGEALNAGLGGGVVGLPAVAEGRDARDVHDATPLGGRHVLLHGAAHEERPAQVHGHDRVPVVFREPEQQVVAGDTGVVDQHRRFPQLRDDPVDRGGHRLGVGDVGGDADRPPAGGHDALGGRLRRGLVAVDDRYGEAVGSQAAGGARADATPPSRDDCGPVLGFERHLRSPLLERTATLRCASPYERERYIKQ